MIIKNVSLETVCGYTSKLPKNTKPEIAFAGKSNVGKSSLINALMNRNKNPNVELEKKSVSCFSKAISREKHRRSIFTMSMMNCI